MFDFLSKMKVLASQPAGMAEFIHKRYHARYLVNDRGLCTVDHQRHGLFRVIDLSHHGCLVESVADSTLDQCALPFTIDLNMCGAKIRLEVSQCQRRKNGWGLVFRHVHESSIRSISGFIEPMRWGSSAIAIQADRGNDGLMAKYRRRFQGDGPFDLVYEKNDAGQIVFLMATIRRGTEYGSVIWDNGRVVTKKSIDHKGDGARMAQTADVDNALVWACAATCLGMKYVEGAQCAKALNEWLSAEAKTSNLSKSG
jgi:hypothetical protein